MAETAKPRFVLDFVSSISAPDPSAVVPPPRHALRADHSLDRNDRPTLEFAELDKIQRENSYNPKAPVTTSINMPAPPLISPSICSGPPPPYSYPSSTASSVVGVSNGLVSPPESRRTSDDDKEQPARPRQSLPSIHEALRADQPMSISSMLSSAAAPPHASDPVISTSPTSITSRYQEHTPTKPATSFSQNHFTPSYHQPSRRAPSHYSPRTVTDSGVHRPPPINTTSFQPKVATSPVTAPRSNGMYSSHSSPRYDRLPTSNPQTAQSPYHSAFQYAAQAPPVTYPVPSMPYPAWRPPPDVDQAQAAMNGAPKTSPPGAYGATVKRQLDIFDLELSLNEVCFLISSSFWYMISLTDPRVLMIRSPKEPKPQPISLANIATSPTSPRTTGPQPDLLWTPCPASANAMSKSSSKNRS